MERELDNHWKKVSLEDPQDSPLRALKTIHKRSKKRETPTIESQEIPEEDLVSEYIHQVKLLFENLSEAIRKGLIKRSYFKQALTYVQRINRETFGAIESNLACKVKLSSSTVEDRNQECPICKETFGRKKVVSLNCEHSFHESCIKEWTKWGNYCPLCRSSLN